MFSGILLVVMICTVLVSIRDVQSRKPIDDPPIDVQIKFYGYVKDLGGNRVGYAAITIRDGSGRICYRDLTSSTGYYSVTLTAINHATYTIQASKSGYVTHTKSRTAHL